MNDFLFQVECVLHGHVTVDGTFVVISLPTKSPGSAMMVSTDSISFCALGHTNLFIHGANSIVGAFQTFCVVCGNIVMYLFNHTFLG